jgi:iron complex transport system substrate-binding protein
MAAVQAFLMRCSIAGRAPRLGGDRAPRHPCLAIALILTLGVPGFGRPLRSQSPPPQRIVSLVPATTEMLFAIGAGPRVVGVGTYDHFPPAVERLPRLGGLLDPNVEQLIALRPELVVLYDTQGDLRQQLERSHVPFWPYAVKGLSDVTTTMRQLGDRIGLHAEAEARAARIDERLRAVASRVSGQARPRTLLIFGREPGALRGINASGGYGFLHDLLELAGGVDVLADIKQASVSMSTEMILATRPEVIIELHYGNPWPVPRAEAERRVWNALPSLPAVRTGRVYLLGGDELVVPGPRVVEAAEALARTLHPDAVR